MSIKRVLMLNRIISQLEGCAYNNGTTTVAFKAFKGYRPDMTVGPRVLVFVEPEGLDENGSFIVRVMAFYQSTDPSKRIEDMLEIEQIIFQALLDNVVEQSQTDSTLNFNMEIYYLNSEYVYDDTQSKMGTIQRYQINSNGGINDRD